MQWTNILLLSLPESIACLAGTMLLLDAWCGLRKTRAFLFGLIYASVAIISIYAVACYPQTILFRPLLLAALAGVMFRHILGFDWRQAVLGTTLYTLLITIATSATSGLEYLYYDQNTLLYDTPRERIIAMGWPVYALVTAACYGVRQSRWGPLFKKLPGFSGENSFLKINLIIILQTVLLSGSLMDAAVSDWGGFNVDAVEYMAMGGSFLVFFFSSLVLIAYVSSLAEELSVQRLEARLSRQIGAISLFIKAARHDFMHHMQVLNILCQEGSISEFRRYLKQVEEGVKDSVTVIQSPGEWIERMRQGEVEGEPWQEALSAGKEGIYPG